MMKKIFFYFLLVNTVIVSSQKIAFSIKNDSINNKFSLESINNKVLETITIKQNDFNIDIHLEEGYYLLKKDKKEVLLYLKPNDELEISFDSYNFYKSFVITGNGADRNNYLFNRNKKFINSKGKLSDFYSKDFYEGSEIDYSNKLDKLYKGFFSSLFSNSFNKKFVDTEMKDLQYAYSLDLLKFEEAKKHYKFKDSTLVSKYFLEPLARIHFDNSALFKKYYSYKKLTTLKWKRDIKNVFDYKEMQKMISSIKTADLKESVLEKLSEEMFKEQPEEMDTYFKLIKSNSINKQLISNLKGKYSEIKKLKTAENLSNFKFLNHNNEAVKLSNFKGKYIFMYVWVSWSNNYIEEFEKIKKLRKKYSNENIVFIGVSVDKKEKYKDWENIVKEHDIDGAQLFLNDSKANFIKTYNMSSLPNFLILSLNGEKMKTEIKELSTDNTIKILNELFK